MKLVLILAAVGGGYIYLRSEGIDLTTGDGWSKLAVKFGAKPCNCNGALPIATNQANASSAPGVIPSGSITSQGSGQLSGVTDITTGMSY